jgi:hypothetical protein
MEEMEELENVNKSSPIVPFASEHCLFGASQAIHGIAC